jgi:hypothetical protein
MDFPYTPLPPPPFFPDLMLFIPLLLASSLAPGVQLPWLHYTVKLASCLLTFIVKNAVDTSSSNSYIVLLYTHSTLFSFEITF